MDESAREDQAKTNTDCDHCRNAVLPSISWYGCRDRRTDLPVDETGEPGPWRRVGLGWVTAIGDRGGVVDPVVDGHVREDDGNIAANKVFQEKRVTRLELVTFSLGRFQHHA